LGGIDLRLGCRSASKAESPSGRCAAGPERLDGESHGHLGGSNHRARPQLDSTRHRNVVRNDRQPIQGAPIELEPCGGGPPQEPEVFQGDPRSCSSPDRPPITSGGYRFKIYGRVMETPACLPRPLGRTAPSPDPLDSVRPRGLSRTGRVVVRRSLDTGQVARQRLTSCETLKEIWLLLTVVSAGPIDAMMSATAR
jgi:hypothetical protein